MRKWFLSVCSVFFLSAGVVLAQSRRTNSETPVVQAVPNPVSPPSHPSATVKGRNPHAMKVASMPYPKMVYPGDSATNIPLIPKFQIVTVIGGVRYDLQIATDENFYNVVQTDWMTFPSPTDSVFQFRFDPSVTDPGAFTDTTTYYWRVEVTDSSGQNTSGWSEPYSYKTTSAAAPVSQPTLSLPTDYDTVPWVGTTFYWYPSSGATQYQVQWSTSYYFSGFTYYWASANQTSLTEDLKPNTTYYWRVLAYNDGTISQFSPTGTFYTPTVDTLTAASGSFDDGSGTDNYVNGLDVAWLIAPPNANQISLSFSSFETVAGSDYVTVYDGSTTNAPILAQLTGDTISTPITSSGGSMLVRFTTGYNGTAPGWTADYYSVNRTDAITGKVLDLGFDPWTGDSSVTPLPQATVRFYDGNSLLGNASINGDGTFSFGGLDSSQTYKIIVSAAGNDPITQQQFTLRYQNSARTTSSDLAFTVPLSLYETKYGLIDSLEQPSIDLSSVTDFGVGTININGYDESGAASLLNTWSNLSTPLSNTYASSLIRLTLAEGMTNRFLGDASSLSIGTLQTLYPFIQRLVGMCTIGNFVEQSVDALIGDLGNTLLNSALQQAQSLVNSQISKIPPPDGPQLQVATNLLFLGLYSATEQPGQFATDRAINNFAIPLGTRLLLENYYIPLATQSTLSAAIFNSTLGYMSGSEGGAFSMSNGIYETSHAQTTQTLSDANNYLQASNWISFGSTITGDVGAILTLSGIGTPLGLALSGVSAVASVGAAGTAGIALYENFSRLANIPHDLSGAVNSIYNPILSKSYRVFAARQAYGKIKGLDAMRSGLRVASDDYNSELTNFLAQINAGNRTAAKSIIPALLSLDSALNSQMRFSSYTMNASFVVADTSISGFDNMYSSANDSILSSMAVRQATYLNVLAYLMDSTSSAYTDSIGQYGQMTIAANNQMVSSVNQTLSIIQTVGIPGFIAPISSRAPASVGAGSNFIVGVSFKNFGGTVSSNLFAKLFLTSGFTAVSDSTSIGELGPGAIDSISFTVTAPNADTTGSYSILFMSSDASSSSASGPLRSTNATGVGQILPSVPKNYALLQNYPNPFNPSTVIEYAIPVKSHVTVTVYDVLGRVVDILVNEVKYPGTYKVVFDASSLPSGAYFYRIMAGNFVETKKLMVVK